MTSSFGWLALDPEHRRRMMEAVDQFRDQGTIDDLGLGGIRDAFSDSLFPGTSTLHTRLRYALFIPWLLQEASHKETLADMQSAFRENEFRLIDALKRGETAEGVMGREARRNLQRLPRRLLGVCGTQEPRISVWRGSGDTVRDGPVAGDACGGGVRPAGGRLTDQPTLGVSHWKVAPPSSGTCLRCH